MGRYSKITAQNMSDILSGLRAFLTSGGWTVQDLTDSTDETYSRTRLSALKNSASHRFCIVTGGRFPFAVTQGGMYGGSWRNESGQISDGYGRYNAAFGMQHGEYLGGEYYLIAPELLFPCRCYFFETSDQGLLCSFEVAPGRWQHVYAGFFNKSRTGAWAGGWIMSGSTTPARGLTAGADNGLFLRNGNTNYANYYPMTTIFSYLGYLCGYAIYGSGAYIPTGWPTGGLGSLQTRPSEWTMIFEGNDGKLINSISANQLIGLPTLYPLTMTYFKEGRALYGAYLTDLFVCRMNTVVPGEEFSLGNQKYVAVPRYLYSASELGIAVRVN